MSDGESGTINGPDIEFQTLDTPQMVIGIFVVAAVLPFFCAMGACFGAEEPVYSVAGGAIAVGAVATFFAVRFAKSRQIELAIDSEKIRRVGTDGEETVISWSEPHEVWFEGVQFFAGPVPAGTHRETEVVAPDGRRIEIGMAKKEAHDAIVNYSTAAQLPRALERIKAGESVEFGPLSLSDGRLLIGTVGYPVEDIEEIEIRDGKLRILADGNWFARKTDISDIPNYSTLVLLLDELRS